MTKREKRLIDLRNRIARMEAGREAAIKMLVKAETVLPGLHKQLNRMEQHKRITKKMIREELVPGLMAVGTMPDDGLDIPPELDRNRKLQAMADPKTKEKKAERRVVEKEHREAELRGQKRKWPATGRAAQALTK
jgi:hypothetical protein